MKNYSNFKPVLTHEEELGTFLKRHGVLPVKERSSDL